MLGKDSNNQNKDDGAFNFETFEVIDNDIYFQVMGKNIIARISPENNKTEILGLDEEYRFKHCASKNGKIYFADNLGEAFVVYDVNSRTRKIYPMDSHEREDNNIAAVVCYGECVFAISQYKGIIYIFDIVGEKLRKDYTLNQKIKKKYKGEVEYIRCWKAGSSLYLRISTGNGYEILKYDLSEKRFESAVENIFPDELIDAFYHDGKIYILQDKSNLIIWDVKNNTKEKVYLLGLHQLLGADRDKRVISTLAVTKRNIWFFPTTFGEDIFIYDIFKNSISKYCGYPEDFCYAHMENWSKYADIKKRGNYIYVAARLSNYYLLIDAETGEGTWKPAYMDCIGEYYQHLLKKMNSEGGVVSEQDIPLHWYLDYLQKDIQNVMESGNVGAGTWGKLK